MLNIPELERRWKKYRFKRRLPLYLTGTVLFLAAAAVTYLSWSGAPEGVGKRFGELVSTAQAATRSLVATAPAETARTAGTETVAPVAAQTSAEAGAERKAEVTRLQPSMLFMQDFEQDDTKYYFNTEPAPKARKASAPVSAPQPVQQPPVQTPVRETRLPAISAPVQEKRFPAAEAQPAPVKEIRTASAPKKMLIQREENMKDVQDVIARFKKNKNPALSLFIAKRYYAIGNYQQAYNYALITNDLDRGIEDSWLIFAKSLYKLDQKARALNTLKAYAQESGSVKAKITIEQMENETFK